MHIFENTIIAFNGLSTDEVILERVLWISLDKSQVVLIDINNKDDMKFPYFRSYSDLIQEIEDEHARTFTIEPDLKLLAPDEEYLKKYEGNRDEKWHIIKSIVTKEPEAYLPEYRGQLIKEAMDRTGKSAKVIYQLIKKYWFYGKSINSLLNNYFDCGVPSEARIYNNKPGPKSEDGNTYIITDSDKVKFRKAIKKYHVSEEKTIKETFKHMLEDSYNEGYYRKYGVMVPIIIQNCPTERQFRYWYSMEYDSKQKYGAKYGNRKAEMNARALMGTPAEDIQGPGALFEIDSTPADVILMSLDRQTVIGRAHVYFVKDVMSRTIAGAHVCTNPSWEEEMVALENAATDKVEYCAKHEIDITEEDWPCHHLPKFIIGDRGEHKSKNSNNLVNIRVRVANAPSYRGDLKPYIEQQFRKFCMRMRELSPGAVRKEHRVRGDKNPADEAMYTIEAFTKLVILFVIEFNKSALSAGYFVTKELFEEKVELTPLSVWNWGLKRNLLHEMPRDLLRYSLLPKGNAMVTRGGIAFSKVCYTCDRGIREAWFENEQFEGKKHIEISYDPRNCSSIFIKSKDGSLIPCYLTTKFKDYEGLHFDDLKVILTYKKNQLKKLNKGRIQLEAEMDAYAGNLTISETEKTKKALLGKSKASKHRNKRLVRKMDKRSISSRNAWTTAPHHIEKESQILPKGEVLPFERSEPKKPQSKMDQMQLFLMSKNKERRINREREH